MKMTDVRNKAKQLGIKIKNVKKTDLIRKIQAEEGNLPCFQTENVACGQEDCCWRKDCLD